MSPKQSNAFFVCHSEQSEESSSTPSAATNVVAISAGPNFSMALKADGTVLAWGDNTSGQTNVPPGLRATFIAAGYNHGTVVGWGALAPTQALSSVTAIALGDSQGLALKQDGTVVGWGSSSTLPNGMISNVTMIAAGEHSMALIGNSAPRAVSLPRAVVAKTGMTVMLKSDIVGRLPLSLQWIHNGDVLVAETNRFISLHNVGRSSAGSYALLVSNELGTHTITNSSVQVTVRQRLRLSVNEENLELRFRDEDGTAMTAELLGHFGVERSVNLTDWLHLPAPLLLEHGDVLLLLPLSDTNSPQLFRVVEQ